MKRLKRSSIISLSLFLLIILVDQITKYLTRLNLEIGESIDFSFFSLTHVQNTGASFGLFQGNNHILTIISLLVFAFVVYLFYSEEDNKYSKVLVIFGAGIVGNLIDRLFFGSVTDFLNFHFWPVFNIADSALTVSVTWMIYLMIKEK
jgi:signal peptidase II